MSVESHSVRFRHNTEDVDWLAVVGEKKWVVLMADLAIGRNPLELDALLASKVKAFALIREELSAVEQAQAIITALPQIFRLLEETHYPFIAKIYQDGSVAMWKTEPIFQIIQKGRKRYRPSKKAAKW